MSVIGVVGQQDTVKSPSSSVPPEKKQKKDKPPSKTMKSSDSSSKIAELDSKWSERFNRLEALLLSKSLQPTFSSEIKMAPPHSAPTNIPRDSEPFFQPLGALARTSLQKCISQPASQSRIHRLLQQSALARVSLLHSINQPASSHPTDRNPLHHLSALARVPLQL